MAAEYGDFTDQKKFLDFCICSQRVTDLLLKHKNHTIKNHKTLSLTPSNKGLIGYTSQQILVRLIEVEKILTKEGKTKILLIITVLS